MQRPPALRSFSDASIVKQAMVREFAIDWQRRAGQTVLDAYLGAVADSPLHGASRPAALALIELFVLEKLLREITHGSTQIGLDRMLPMQGLLSHLRDALA